MLILCFRREINNRSPFTRVNAVLSIVNFPSFSREDEAALHLDTVVRLFNIAEIITSFIGE